MKTIEKKKSGAIDRDWAEICEDFDLDINAETLRKAGVGIKLASDAHMLNDPEDGDVSSLSGGYVDRQKMRDLTRQVNKVYRAEARSELLREAIADGIRNLPEISIVSKYCLPRGVEHRALAVALGDFHYGAEIEVKGLRGETINRYDHQVFEERMANLLGEIKEIVAKENIKEIHLFLVGDLIDGMLRQSQLMRLEYGMVESTIRLSEYMALWIAKLARIAAVYVYGCTGNHSEVRPLKSKNREFEDENLEKIIFWYLEERLRECSNVVFCGENQRMVLANVKGYSFLLLHGDGEKSIDQIARDAVNLYGEHIDFFICGHLHKEQEFPAGMTGDGNSVIVRTPSICGVDKYAQGKGYGGRPGAIAMVIEEGYGRRCVYPINL